MLCLCRECCWQQGVGTRGNGLDKTYLMLFTARILEKPSVVSMVQRLLAILAALLALCGRQCEVQLVIRLCHFPSCHWPKRLLFLSTHILFLFVYIRWSLSMPSFLSVGGLASSSMAKVQACHRWCLVWPNGFSFSKRFRKCVPTT